MDIINLTSHAIVLRNRLGVDTTISPSGKVARVSSTPGTELNVDAPCAVYSAPTWGELVDLPAPQADTIYIVSALVAARCVGRDDVFSPGTGPGDEAVRDSDGKIVAVTRLIQAAQN